MKVNGKKIKEMAKEKISIRMEEFMKEIGKKIWLMGMEN
jgi:hypothetical protein